MKALMVDDGAPAGGRAALPVANSAAVRWAWPAAALLILAVLLAPLLAVDVPAVLDYPNHLARFYILAHPGDPGLSRMYAAHWAPLPNIGMDVIGAALLRVLPVHVAGRVLLALTLVAPLAGTALYARAAFGRWTWWSLGAGVVGFNGIFFLGFMNFLLGVGVALAGAAAWRVLRRRLGWATALAGAAIGLCAYFCHLLGFAFFGLLITAQEAAALLALRREKRLSWPSAMRPAAMLIAAAAPAVAFYLLTYQKQHGGDAPDWHWSEKSTAWATPFFTYDIWLTLLTVLVLFFVGTEVRRGARRASGVALALATLIALFAVAPFSAAGGVALEARLMVMAAFLAFAGLDPQLPARKAQAIAAALAALGVARSTEVALNWQGRAQDLADLRATLASVAPGSKVLQVRTEFQHPLSEGRGRMLQGYCRLDEHMAALAVLERGAFWPQLFADPSQQPVAVLPPYARLSTLVEAEWKDLARPLGKSADGRYPYPKDWRRQYDYVLVVGPPPPAASTPSGLRLVRANAETSLYRIDHAAPAA